jgi:hypothetical protein
MSGLRSCHLGFVDVEGQEDPMSSDESRGRTLLQPTLVDQPGKRPIACPGDWSNVLSSAPR